MIDLSKQLEELKKQELQVVEAKQKALNEIIPAYERVLNEAKEQKDQIIIQRMSELFEQVKNTIPQHNYTITLENLQKAVQAGNTTEAIQELIQTVQAIQRTIIQTTQAIQALIASRLDVIEKILNAKEEAPNVQYTRNNKKQIVKVVEKYKTYEVVNIWKYDLSGELIAVETRQE